jgi:hypothetical protein
VPPEELTRCRIDDMQKTIVTGNGHVALPSDWSKTDWPTRKVGPQNFSARGIKTIQLAVGGAAKVNPSLTDDRLITFVEPLF